MVGAAGSGWIGGGLAAGRRARAGEGGWLGEVWALLPGLGAAAGWIGQRLAALLIAGWLVALLPAGQLI